MLFNSYAFIFVFLPVTLVVFFLLGRARQALAAGWLTAASLFFYGWWNPAFVGLLLVARSSSTTGGARPCRPAPDRPMPEGGDC